MSSDIHVLPVGDLYEHRCDRACWCQPTESDDDERVVIHHAADGREQFESSQRKTS